MKSILIVFVAAFVLMSCAADIAGSDPAFAPPCDCNDGGGNTGA